VSVTVCIDWIIQVRTCLIQSTPILSPPESVFAIDDSVYARNYLCDWQFRLSLLRHLGPDWLEESLGRVNHRCVNATLLIGGDTWGEGRGGREGFWFHFQFSFLLSNPNYSSIELWLCTTQHFLTQHNIRLQFRQNSGFGQNTPGCLHLHGSLSVQTLFPKISIPWDSLRTLTPALAAPFETLF